MLHKKRYHNYFVFVILFILLFTACSSQSEDKDRGFNKEDIPKSVPPTYVPDDTVESKDSQDSKRSDKSETATYSLGEAVEEITPTEENPENIGISYTVNSATVFTTPEEAGIDTTRMNDYIELLYGDPRIDPNVLSSQDLNDYDFLKCMINIKNLNYEERLDLNISSLNLVYIMPDTKKVYPVSAPIYFSAPDGSAFPEQKNAGEYWHYYVPKGQSLDTQVIWPILPELHEKENLYLAVNYSTYNRHPIKYIKLDLG